LNQIKKIISLKTENERVDRELSSLKEENLNLKERLSYIQTEDFIRQEARDKLGLAEPNEIAYLIPPLPDLNFKKDQPSLLLPAWKQWWQLFWY